MKIKDTNNRVLFEAAGDIRATLIAAGPRTDLTNAYLANQDLHGLYLDYFRLNGACLDAANLSHTRFNFAVLRGADIQSANCTGTKFCYADMQGIQLAGAVLDKAVLTHAELDQAEWAGARLQGVDLSVANLSGTRADFIAEVLQLPNELEFLAETIKSGKINGSSYSGVCSCLAGTLARAKGIKSYSGEDITNGGCFHTDVDSPREQFFFAIKTGDTPATNGASALALTWTGEAIAIRDNIRTSRKRRKSGI